MIEKYPRVRMEHPMRGTPEFTGDSIRAVARAVENHAKVIDFNLLPYLRGHGAPSGIAVAHYDLPCHHRFKATDEFRRNQRITDSDWTQISTLTAKWLGKTYVIHQMPYLFNLALMAGVGGIEGDLKAPISRDDLAKALEQVTHPDRVVFKAMATASPTAYRRLKPAHELGRTTVLLCHRPGIKIPGVAEEWIDYYRGFRPTLV